MGASAGRTAAVVAGARVICKNCTIAGRLIAERSLTPRYTQRRREIEAQITYWHGRCLAPTTCPCQHRLEA